MLAALPIEPWVREMAAQFNAKGARQDGQPIEVQVTAMDGLTALGKFDRDEFGTLGSRTRDQLSRPELQKLETTFPTVWIPDSRYLVELANAAYKERLGRDVYPDRRRVSRKAGRHLALHLGPLPAAAPKPWRRNSAR